MNSIVNFVTHFKDFYYDINGSTFTGAIDVIVVEQPDGTFTSSPFHVRFGKLGVLHSKEKIVDVEINGVPLDFHMKLGDCGEAFFVEKVNEKDFESNGIDQRNLYCSPIPADNTVGDQEKIPEIHANGFSLGNVHRKESKIILSGMFTDVEVINNQLQNESQPKIFCAETSVIKVSEKISSLNSDFRPIIIEPAIESVNLVPEEGIELKRSDAVINVTHCIEEEVGGEDQKSDADVGGDKVKKRKKMFIKKRGKRVTDEFNSNKLELKSIDLDSSLTQSLDLELGLQDSDEVSQSVTESSNAVSSKSAGQLELRCSTSMELAGLDRSSTNDNDFHFFSDSEAGPESSYWDNRQLTSILSDSELDKKYCGGEADKEEQEKQSWKWGELPTPPQQNKSLCSPRDGSEMTTPTCDTHHQEQHRSMLSGMFSFMKKTKHIRHNPESKDVYLGDISVDQLDPEVSALYFPHSYSTRKTEETEQTADQAGGGGVVIMEEKDEAKSEPEVSKPGESLATTEIAEENEEKEIVEVSLVNSKEFNSTLKPVLECSETEIVLKGMEQKLDLKIEIGENLQNSEVVETCKTLENNLAERLDCNAEIKGNQKDVVIDIESGSPVELEKSIELEAKCPNEEDVESGYGASLPQSPDIVQQVVGWRDLLKDVAMSRCGGLSDKGPSEEAFLKSSITYEEFTNNPKLLEDPNLVVRLDGKYLNWKTVCPIVMSIVMFNRGLSQNALDALNREYMPKQKPDKPAEAKSYTSWWSWRRPEQKKALIKEEGEPVVKIVEEVEQEVKEVEENTKLLYSNEKFPVEEGVLYRKTLRLSSDQIKELNLKSGENEVVFSVTSAYQGTTQCKCHIYRWRYDDKVVISDIDGTITKSDVLGHLLPILGKDWAQSGVAQLFNKIKNNGYKLLYLSARAIGQAGITRDYLKSIKQEDLSLPEGPLLLSPTGLLNALCREVIEKRPEDFKIPCLKDIQALFPPESNPFYAGYGNKVNDVWSYRAVGIPMFRIFTINHRGELKHEFTQTFQTTYSNLSYLVDHMFPPFSETVLFEDFSSFVYWREPIEDVSVDPVTKAVVKKVVESDTDKLSTS